VAHTAVVFIASFQNFSQTPAIAALVGLKQNG